MEIGARVYAWNPETEDLDICEMSNEFVIGNLESIEEDRKECIILSILDGKYHRRYFKNVYVVGTGPIINSNAIKDDYGDFNAFF